MAAGSVSIGDAIIVEGDTGTKTLIFAVVRSGGADAFSVDFATSDQSATVLDGDYLAAAGTVAFGANVTTRTISITINGDTKLEPNETFLVGLSNATNGATISDGSGTGTVINDEPVAGSVLIGDAIIVEGDTGTQMLTFALTRTGGTSAFSVEFATSDQTATVDDGDYVAASGTVAFGASVNTQTISIAINGDTKLELNETFLVELANATNGATIADGSGTGIITNDEPVAGFISIGDAIIVEGATGTKALMFAVTRTGGTVAFAIDFATSDQTASATDADYVAATGTLAFAANVNTQTISVAISGDTKPELNETFLLSIANATNGGSISDGSGIGTIVNDDGNVINGTPGPDPLVGTAAADVISGLGGNDLLDGRAAGDVLNGGPGNDQIDGGQGPGDTATYSGAFADYNIVRLSDGFVRVADTRPNNPDGFDNVTSVEQFQFGGATKSLAQIIDITDFNIFWHQASTNFWRDWTMTSGTVGNNLNVGGAPAEWDLKATGDFNADGIGDAIWTNTSTGDIRSIQYSPSGIYSVNVLGTLPSGWAPIGSGDFNGDGASDLILENLNSGELRNWTMQNGTLAGNTVLGALPPQWRLTGTGDFNGDGTYDIFWRNISTGEIREWTMANGVISNNIVIGALPSSWGIAATGDFNHDHSADIIWRNVATGDTRLWLMANGTVASNIVLPSPPPEWKLIAAGDYDQNGNGADDLIWQNSSTGEVREWLIANGAVINNILLGTTPTDFITAVNASTHTDFLPSI